MIFNIRTLNLTLKKNEVIYLVITIFSYIYYIINTIRIGGKRAFMPNYYYYLSSFNCDGLRDCQTEQ